MTVCFLRARPWSDWQPPTDPSRLAAQICRAEPGWGSSLKKSLTLVVLAALLLTGCSGKAAAEATSKQSAIPSSTASAAVAGVIVPNEIGKTLDKAQKELEGLGFKVKASDTVEGKEIIVKANWDVISQDPVAASSVPKSSTITLGVKHNTNTPSQAPTPTLTPTPTPAAEVGAGAGTGADTGVGTGAGANGEGSAYVNPDPVSNVPNVGVASLSVKTDIPGQGRHGRVPAAGTAVSPTSSDLHALGADRSASLRPSGCSSLEAP